MDDSTPSLPGIPLPLPVPPDLPRLFGYPGAARFVAFNWEPSGDEVMYDDGRLSGTGDGYAFLTFRGHRSVAPHLEPFNLGASDAEAEHALVIDSTEGQVSVAPVREAHAFVHQQHPPLPELTLEQLEAACRALETDAAAGWQEIQIDPAVIEHRLKERGEAMARLVSFLDEWGQRP